MAAAISVNLAGFHESWTKWLLEQSVQILAVYRGLAAEIFTYMVHETPQYTGESAANWTLAGAHPVYSSGSGLKQAYEASAPRGHRTPWNKAEGGGPGANPVAVEMALSHLQAGLPSVRSITDSIFITNATRWDSTGNVGEIIEGQPRWLRSPNRVGMVPAEAVSYVQSMNSGVLDDLQIARLARMAT